MIAVDVDEETLALARSLGAAHTVDARDGDAAAAIVAHGPNAAGTARLVVFANNPLYRADPEREWPMVAAAAYWAMTDTPR